MRREVEMSVALVASDRAHLPRAPPARAGPAWWQDVDHILKAMSGLGRAASAPWVPGRRPFGMLACLSLGQPCCLWKGCTPRSGAARDLIGLGCLYAGVPHPCCPVLSA